MLREELLVIIDGGWWPVPRRTTRRVLQHDKAPQNRDVDHVTHRHNLFLSHIYTGQQTRWTCTVSDIAMSYSKSLPHMYIA